MLLKMIYHFSTKFHVFICARLIKLFHKRSAYGKYMNLGNEHLIKNVIGSSFDAWQSYTHGSTPYSISSLLWFIYCCIDCAPITSFTKDAVSSQPLDWMGGESLLHCCSTRYTPNILSDMSTVSSSHSWICVCHSSKHGTTHRPHSHFLQ
jgi:hypothetical protein